MNLSHKLTFSLTSIILLMVFAVVPVMAHDASQIGDLRAHSHPTPTLAAQDMNGDGDTNDVGEGTVSAHNVHPKVVSIKLKPIPKSGDTPARARDKTNVVAITSDNDGNTATPGTGLGNNQFILLVDFNIDIGTSGNEPLGTADFTSALVDATKLTDKDSVNNIEITSVTVDSDDASMFEVKITIDPQSDSSQTTNPADALPNGIKDDDDEKLYLQILVSSSAVTGIAGTAKNLNGVGVVDAPGSQNAVSTSYEFVLVKSLPALPVVPDTEKPTVKITSDPASGDELPTSGNVVFTFKFSEALGTGSDAFTLGDVTVTGGNTVDFAGSGTTYTLTVKPDSATTDVKVAVTGTVQDAANNDLDTAKSTPAGGMFTYEHYDTVPPTVAISAEKFKDADGNITFIFDFNEPIKTSGDGAFTADDIDRVNSDVAEIVSAPTAYTTGGRKDAYSVKIKPKKAGSVSIQIKINSVEDAAGNMLARDYSGVWNPPTDASQDMVVITGPPLLDSLTATENGITITVTPKGGTITNKLASGEVTVSSGSKSGFAYDNATNTATFNVMPTHGAQFVTVSVAAGAVADSQQNVNKAVSKVFEVAPLITVPANGHAVIVRTRHADQTILSDQPTLALPGVPTPAADITRVNWEHMPDLKVLFNVDGTGSGGGALILKKAHSQPANMAVDANKITISEIMWATDIGILGNLQNDEQAKQQWIELHNRHGHAVKVFIYARAGTDILGSHNDVSNPSGTIVDVVTNYFDGSPGNKRWTVPGKDGNSRTGVNFVSMRRKIDKGNYVNGRASGAWDASPDAYYRAIATVDTSKVYEFRGTPGRVNTFSPAPGPTLRDTTTSVPSNTVIFNEVANRSNKDLEWIELRNVSNGEINLRNYLISIVAAVDSDAVLYQFPANDNAKIPAGGVFLLVATDPWDKPEHPLAVGWDVDKNVEDQIAGWGNTLDDKDVRYKVVSFGSNGLPDNGKFVLILRRPDNHEGQRSGGHNDKGVAETGNADLDKIVDIAGWHDALSKSNYTNQYSSTDLWPLHQFGKPEFSNNKLHADTVHGRRHVRSNKDDRGGAGAVDNNNGKTAFTDAGYTGIGYKRQAERTNANGGTPGYHGVERSLATQAKLIIGEVMLSQGGEMGRNALPQWIEIYNPTDYAVQLDADAGWRIVIEEERIALRTINFKDKGTVKRVLPGEAVIVVSSTARSYGSDYLPASTVFPSTRVFNIHREGLGGHFGMQSRYDGFINPDSFNLRLVDGKGNVSDEIGNLDGNIRTSDTAKWKFSEGTIVKKDGYRTSLIRVLDDGVARNGLSIGESNVLPLGAKEMDDSVNLARGEIPAKYAWIRAAQANFDPIFVRHTWYGNEHDYGTPLNSKGKPLPVSLSSFRPTLEDGKVTIRWTTESELDNAGFNILRSETRNGEFTQVNEQMIQGNGTTAERSTYKWVDTTAKPGAVYYYQIEDVSYAGEHTTLLTTKLKGLISAKGKLTTQWGDLKNLR